MAAKKKTTKKKKKDPKPIDFPGGNASPKHRDANRGEDVTFNNPSKTKPLTIHFDSSPFLDSLGPSTFTVPANGSRTRTISKKAVVGDHYPYDPRLGAKKKTKKKTPVRREGPPGPPDVIVAG